MQHYSKRSTWMLLVSFVIIRNNTRVSYVHNSVSENPKSPPEKRMISHFSSRNHLPLQSVELLNPLLCT
jgi:hypothetical protein